MSKSNFLDSFQDKLGNFASKISANPYIIAIRDGMLAYMPFTIIASIFLICAAPPIQQISDFVTSITGLEEWVWQSKFYYVSGATLDIGALLVIISLSKNLSKQLNTDEMPSILTSVVSFILLSPQANIEGANYLKVATLSAQALFLAMIVSFITVNLYKKVNDKGLKIKMPDSVPPAVSAPFESIIPSLLVVTFFWLIRLLLETFYGGTALEFINYIVATPLKFLVGGSVFGIVFAKIFEQLLWFFGIHGGAIIGGLLGPILQVLQEENRVASMAGEALPNIINQSFFDQFCSIGIIGAVIAILIVSKSKTYKTIGKVASAPIMFNIGEPALFGIPLMLNFTYIIPFILSNALSAIISYIAFSMHLVAIPNGMVQMPWTTPPILSGYLVTGSISGALLQVVLIVVATLFWIPFVKNGDKQNIIQEEKELENKEKE